MSVDGTKMGEAAASLMEKLDGYPEGSELREVLILAEVEVPSEPEADEETFTSFDYWCTSKRAIIRAGMAEMAREYFVAVEQPGDSE